MIRAGQGTGEFGDADADEVALLLCSLLDGLAVQATLHDPDVARERMLCCVLEMAESLLDCELGAAAYKSAAGDGPARPGGPTLGRSRPSAAEPSLGSRRGRAHISRRETAFPQNARPR